MSVGKTLRLGLGLCFLWLCIVGCEGDQGPQGPPGFDGQDGTQGQNFVPAPIADQVIGFLVNNSTSGDFNGALKVSVTSRADATPSATQIVARELAASPMIDGRIRGDEWAALPQSTVAFGNVGGSDNGVANARVRLGYNRDYVFMLAEWTETVQAGFVAAADTTWRQWTYNASTWSQSGGEDRFFVLWEIGDVTGWDANGAGAVFNGSQFATQGSETADLWVWLSTQTYYVSTAADRVVISAATPLGGSDWGEPYSLLNGPSNSLPAYMAENSDTAGTNYPMRSFEYVGFDPDIRWLTGAKIPGVVSLIPTASLANVRAQARFDNGTWTLEIIRLRNTGWADDARI